MNKRVVERFNREADVWDHVHSNPATDIIQWEIKKRKLLARDFIYQQFKNKPAAILEVGCGAGRNLEEIFNGNQNWTGKGVDISPAMVERCEGQYQRRAQYSFEVLDIENEYLEERFDVIVLLGVIGYLDSNGAAFRNIQRMLRPGGFVIFTFGNAPSICRSLRSGWRLIKNVSKHILRKSPEGKLVESKSLFRCYRRSEILNSIPSDWRLIDCIYLAFGVGIFGKMSVTISQIFERVFKDRDPFHLALTTFVIARRNDSFL
jgi:SAM-dependent methyltransferase